MEEIWNLTDTHDFVDAMTSLVLKKAGIDDNEIDLSALNEAERVFMMTHTTSMLLCDGGFALLFTTYFLYHYKYVPSELVKAYTAIGATDIADECQKVFRAVFGEKMPDNIDALHEFLDEFDIDTLDGDAETIFVECNERFFASYIDEDYELNAIYALSYNYITKNEQYFK